MATIPRTYIIATKDVIAITPPKNGQILASCDSDEVWYDAPDDGTVNGNPVRRKISGVQVVSELPDASKRQSGIVYVLTNTGKTLPNTDPQEPVYELYVWLDTLNSWQVVGNNYLDRNVYSARTGAAWLNGHPMYITGSPEESITTGHLLKISEFYLNYDDVNERYTLNVPYVNGTAANATTAIRALDADRAGSDNEGNSITGYVHSVSGTYDTTNKCTVISVKDGTGTSLGTIVAPNTEYSVFGTTTEGLVPAPNDLDTANKLLTNTGWVNKSSIDIGTADVAKKAYDDFNSSRLISEYLADVTLDNVSSPPQIIFTRGNNTSKPISLYGIFSTSADGLVPKASGSGDTAKFLRGDATWQSLPVFNGNTSGIVPVSGDAAKYLAGDGTWKGAFTGATAGAAGTAGLVPTPPSGDVYYVLSNEGWVVNGAGSSPDPDPTTATYLIGVKNPQAANTATHTNAAVCVVDGKLYQSNDSNTAAQVVDISSTQDIVNKTYEGYTLGSACEYPVTDDIYPDYTDSFTGDGSKTIFNLSHDATVVTEILYDNDPQTNYTLVNCDEYDDTETYVLNDYCVYEGNIYRCTAASTTGTWVAGDWTLVISNASSSSIVIMGTAPAAAVSVAISYTAELATGTIPTSDAVAAFVLSTVASGKVDSRVICDAYDPTHSYNVNDYCMFQAAGDDYMKLYKCDQATAGTPSVPVDFTPSDWHATTIMAEI